MRMEGRACDRLRAGGAEEWRIRVEGIQEATAGVVEGEVVVFGATTSIIGSALGYCLHGKSARLSSFHAREESTQQEEKPSEEIG